jgi:tRNA (guanine26-N2/guanine27-N2)-dimethyltransferase
MSSTTTNDTKDDCYKTITEGSATMVYPADEQQTVFYNPVQVQNRDLSVLMIALYAERRRTRIAVKAKRKELRANMVKGDELKKQLENYEQELNAHELIASDDATEDGIHVLDALAASGLRSMRYWKEIPGVQHVTVNDLDPAAVERAHANLERNNLKDIETKSRAYGIRIQQGDATHEMYTSRKANKDQVHMNDQYDVIDLDPYGSAAPFLDGAVQAVRDGGMLNVTCTDMAALGGSHPETCYGRYNGSMPLQRATYLQEVSLRILLYSLAVTAAKYGRTIKPILSVGMNFYVRCFVEIHDDKAGVGRLSLNIGSVYQSTHCSSFEIVPDGKLSKKNSNVFQPSRAPTACEETGAPFKVGGPLWLGALHDQGVVLKALERVSSKDDGVAPNMALIATKDRIQGLLTSVSEELHDVPLYYTLPGLCHVLSCACPPQAQFKAALVNAGYRVGGYHKDPEAIKTDAPNHVVWDIMRAWCKDNPPKPSSKKARRKEYLQNKKKKQNKNEGENKEESGEAAATETTPESTTEQPSELSISEKILARASTIEVDFTIPKGGVGKKAKVAKFPLNPQKNWGPKPRASGKRKLPEEEKPEDQS